MGQSAPRAVMEDPPSCGNSLVRCFVHQLSNLPGPHICNSKLSNSSATPLAHQGDLSPRARVRRRSWSSSLQHVEGTDAASKEDVTFDGFPDHEALVEETGGPPVVVRTPSREQPVQSQTEILHQKCPPVQNDVCRRCSSGRLVSDKLSMTDSAAALGEEEPSSTAAALGEEDLSTMLPCPATPRRTWETFCDHNYSYVPEAEPTAGKPDLSKSDCAEEMAEGSIVQRVLALSQSIPSMSKKSQVEALDIIQQVASQLLEHGQLEEAVPLGTKLLELREACLGPQHIDTLRSAMLVGSILEGLGKLAEAAEFYQTALEGFEQHFGSENIMTLECVSNVICLLEARGKLHAAELMSTYLLQNLDAVLGAEHPNSARCAKNLGCLLENQGRWREAEPFYSRAAKSFNDCWGPTHRETVDSFYLLACVLEAKGDFEAALPHFRLVLAYGEASFGKVHPETLGSLYNLAAVLEAMGQVDEAEELFRRELAGCVQLLGRGHATVGASVHNLVRFLENQGKWQEAWDIEKQFQEVAAVTRVPLCPRV
mmetsp:Transcript_120947/g.240942  ORF Transcript_120947/g.240942 Transcript_120947/m.240942 type:complete len:541 (+) Transcript_120947:62-1684(+)